MDAGASICLVCNVKIPLPSMVQDRIQLKMDLDKIEECFAANYGFSSEEREQISFLQNSSIYPFCDKCSPVVNNMVVLQTELIGIENKLKVLRLELAKTMIKTYGTTADGSPFLPIKKLILHKFSDKIEQYCSEIEVTPESNKMDKNELSSSTIPIAAVKQRAMSREVAILKRKGKGDKMPISIDEEELEEVTCPVCAKIYRSKKYLDLHMKSHAGSKRPFGCPACEKSFFGAASLKYHLSAKHPNYDELTVGLDPCNPTSGTTEITKVTMAGGQEAHIIIGCATVEAPPRPPDLEDIDAARCIDHSQDNSLSRAGQENDAKIERCENCGTVKIKTTKHKRRRYGRRSTVTVNLECPVCKLTQHHISNKKRIQKRNRERNHDFGAGQSNDTVPALLNDKNIGTLEAESDNAVNTSRQDFPSSEQGAINPASPSPIGTVESANNNGDSSGCGLDVVQNSIQLEELPVPPASLAVEVAPTQALELPSTKRVQKTPRTIGKKRKRRHFFTHIARKTHVKQRMRQEPFTPTLVNREFNATESESPNQNHSVRSIELNLPNYLEETRESDEAIVKEAQKLDETLRKLNFNALLQIEKLQTVLLSPEREDEEDQLFPREVINGVLQSVEKPEQRKLIKKMQMCGPKSKLAEIRAKILDSRDTCALNILNEQIPDELPNRNSIRAGGLKLQERATRHIYPAVEPSKLSKFGIKIKLNGQGGARKSASGATKADRSISPRKAPQIQSSIPWRRIDVEKQFRQVSPSADAQNQEKRKSRPKTPAQPTTSVTHDGKTLILKRISNTPIPIWRPVQAKNSARTSIDLSNVADFSPRPAIPTPSLCHSANSIPDALPYHGRLTTSASIDATHSSPSKMPPDPTKFPIPNKHLAQIAKSIHRRPRKSTKRLQSISRGNGTPKHYTHPGRANVDTTATVNAESTDFTFGPIIQSVHSLHRPTPAPAHLEGDQSHKISRRSPRPQPEPGTSNSFYTPDRSKSNSSPYSPLKAQLQELHRRADVDFVAADKSVASSRHPRVSVPASLDGEFINRPFPIGIRLVEVEDVLKGNSPSEESAPVLTPTPKRRFILSKSKQQGTKPIQITPTPNRASTIGSSESAFAFSDKVTDCPWNVGPIRLKNLESLCEPDTEMEEAELYEPQRIDKRMSPVGVGTPERRVILTGAVASKQRFQSLPKTSYRPFPKNESIPIMRYSEHMRLLMEQRQSKFVQPVPLEFHRGFDVPMETGSVCYAPQRQPSSTVTSIPQNDSSSPLLTNRPPFFLSSIVDQYNNPNIN